MLLASKRITILIFLQLFSYGLIIGQDVKEERLIKNISFHIDNTEFDLAKKELDTLIQIAGINNSQLTFATAYNLKGALYREQSKPKDAIHYYNRSLEIYENLKNERGTAGCYVNIGAIYSGLEELKIALSYYFKALKIYQSINEKKQITILFNNIGTIYQKQKQIQSSNTYLKKAFNMANERGDSLIMAMTTHNLGVNLGEEKLFDSAVVYFNKSLAYLSNYNEGPGHIFNYSQLGNTFKSIGKRKEAEENLLKALRLSEKTGVNSNLEDLYRELSFIAEENKDFEKALNYNRKYTRLKDSLSIEKLQNELIKSEFDNELKQQKKLQQEEKRNAELISKAKLEGKNRIITASLIALFLVFVLVLFIFRGYRQKQKANTIISRQKELVEEKNNEILASINYAKRIQTALLTSDKYFDKYLSNYFILYKPKDIVSGDFYWAVEHNNIFYLIVADCTGHGVPGAFMSLLNISILNELIIERHLTQPDVILNEARNEIIRSLNPEGGDESKDGMDCVLCAFDFKNMKLTYACANNSLYSIRNNELLISRTNKMPVGKSHDDSTPFVSNQMELKKGDMLYLITDGYADQFGGPKQKKYKYKQLQTLLVSNHQLPLNEQKRELLQSFDTWKGNLEQVDDVCILGIKV